MRYFDFWFAISSYRARGICIVGFGDLFLADLRAWREANLAKAGMRGVFPLRLRDTTKLACELIALGFRAYLSSNEGKIGPGFAGRAFDQSLLDDLAGGAPFVLLRIFRSKDSFRIDGR